MNAAWERPGLADREGPLTEWQAAAQRYRRDLNWPVHVRGQVVWLLTHEIEALDTPNALGAAAQNVLRSNNIMPTVFTASDSTGARRVFLARRTDLADLAYRPRLAEFGVEHVWAGATLDLPPSQIRDDRLNWVVGPSLPLPEFAVVSDAIIRAAAAEEP